MANALEMKDVCKSLGGRSIVKDFDLSLGFGQVVCLFGPSGIGKSTILELAAGLLKPDSGEISAQRLGMAYTFQDDALVPWLNARQNLELVLETAMEPRRASRRAMHWLDCLGLADSAHKKPAELSGGMRRRLGIARGLSVGPRLLLMDEPFAFLDRQWQETLAGLIGNLAEEKGAAVLLVSHQMRPLEYLGCPVLDLTPAAGNAEPTPP